MLPDKLIDHSGNAAPMGKTSRRGERGLERTRGETPSSPVLTKLSYPAMPMR